MSPTRDEIPDETLKALCEQLELKPTKKNRLLVAKLVNIAGTDITKLKIALKKAQIAS